MISLQMLVKPPRSKLTPQHLQNCNNQRRRACHNGSQSRKMKRASQELINKNHQKTYCFMTLSTSRVDKDTPRVASSFCRKILLLREHTEKYIGFMVRNGEVAFCFDNWSGEGAPMLWANMFMILF
ncbi:hypothetical protein ACH5RR_015602 [Cinchona calisaya]|uniref:Uncharacterized protein n=1 Tax=Cinchona calisaya TaxID=153742 RepID=A0ABD2ZZ06_9GENT